MPVRVRSSGLLFMRWRLWRAGLCAGSLQSYFDNMLCATAVFGYFDFVRQTRRESQFQVSCLQWAFPTLLHPFRTGVILSGSPFSVYDGKAFRIKCSRRHPGRLPIPHML